MPTTYTQEFYLTKSVQTFTLPPNVTGPVTIDCYGASGGADSLYDQSYGGYAGGTQTFAGGTTFYIYVGGQGSGVSGGWNGGGDGNDNANSYVSYGGGGATDVRTSTSILDRIVVAAGGGGFAQTNKLGGSGGGSTGVNGQATVTNGGGQGGNQIAGGTGGIGSGSSIQGQNGARGQGGAGGRTSSVNFKNGGGGGGGFFGGGGGGVGNSSTSGGAGGGGSSYIGGLSTATTTSDLNFGDGLVRITYTVADPVVEVTPMNASASMVTSGHLNEVVTENLVSSARMTLNPTYSQTATLAMRGQSTLGITANTHVPPISSIGMSAQSTMTVARQASSIFSTLPMTAFASISNFGIFQQFGSLTMFAQAALVLQQTLSRLDFVGHASLTFDNLITEHPILTMTALAELDLDGFLTIDKTLNLSVNGSMTLSPTKEIPVALTMASQGSLSVAETLLTAGLVQMRGRGSLTITGALTVIGSSTLLGASAVMILQSPIRHPSDLSILSRASMGLQPQILIFTVPPFRAFASLTLISTSLSNVIIMSACGQLTIQNTPQIVQEEPYLIVHGDNNDMAFFVTSWPNRGDVRQVVSNRVVS